MTDLAFLNGVTTIDSYAFTECGGLISVVIPDSVTTIGNYAFYNCTEMTDIEIPGNVTSIGNYAFSGCSGLTEITISEGVESIGQYAFQNCTGLTEITIPDSVTSIGEGAFSGCGSLTKMTIPFVGSSATATSASRASLFGYIFGTSSYTGATSVKQSYSSSNFPSYYIPTGLTEVIVTGGDILYGAFYDCYMIGTVTLGDNVSSVGDYAFYGCTGLSEVEFPDSVETIGNYAFRNCDSLTSLDFLNQVQTIGNYAFQNCDGFTELTIPDSVVTIGSYAFENCVNVTSITFGKGVTTISAAAFRNCPLVTELVIPDNVTSIGEGAFAACVGLTKITVPFVGGFATAKQSSETALFGYIFGSNLYGNSSYVGMTEVRQPYSANSGTRINYIPAGLTEVIVTGGDILYGAFYNCSMLTSVTLPDDLTSIGEKAFYNCTGLTTINYNGTIDQWWGISFGSDWNYNSGNYSIVCTDGTLSKDSLLS